MSAILSGLEAEAPMVGGGVRGPLPTTSLCPLENRPNEAIYKDDDDVKVVNRKSQSVQTSRTSASDRTRLTEACQEDVVSKESSIDGHEVTAQADDTDADKARLHSVASNLVVFDYDDTLLPTFDLATSQRHPFEGQLVDPASIREELDQLSEAILVNFNNVLKVARLMIVTNASSEWFTQSCERYLPKIFEFFIEHNIRIISARDRFEKSQLAQKHWKYFIFIDLVEELFMEHLRYGVPFSVCSIGDGAEERDACLKVASILKKHKCVFKNLKFLSQPTLSYLIQQHVLLSKSFDSFFQMETSADLCILFDKKNAEN